MHPVGSQVEERDGNASTPDDFKCLECGADFSTRTAWRNHLFNVHNVIPDEVTNERDDK